MTSGFQRFEAAESMAGHIQRVSELNDMDRLLFARKLFSFFSLQKLATALFVSSVYNEELTDREGLREFISRSSNLVFLIVSSFIMLLVLILVHSLMPRLRSQITALAWGRVQIISFILFTVSEAWVIAFIMLKSDDSTVFFFTNILTAMVFSVSLFLSSSNKSQKTEEPLLPHLGGATGGSDYQNVLKNFTWKRGLSFIMMTLLVVFAACIILVDMRYAQWITLIICLLGGLCFGCFIIFKAFQLLTPSHHKQ